jgi:hypothetical protein
MTRHITDRWHLTATGPDGKTRRIRTTRYGTPLRYSATYLSTEGGINKNFAHKAAAALWLATEAPRRLTDPTNCPPHCGFYHRPRNAR